VFCCSLPACIKEAENNYFAAILPDSTIRKLALISSALPGRTLILQFAARTMVKP
jgi:hypothetical protein